MKRLQHVVLLSLLGMLAPCAHAEVVNVAIWDFERGLAGHPIVNPSMSHAIEDGVGGELAFIEVNELTEATLAPADLLYLWAFRDVNETINPLTGDEQAALLTWVENGGSVLIVLDYLSGWDSQIGTPFGASVLGSVFEIGTGGVTAHENFLTDGPFGQPVTIPYDAAALLSESELLTGFIPTAWVSAAHGGHVMQGYWDWGVIAPGSGVVVIHTDTTYMAEGTPPDEGLLEIVSNFFAHAVAGAPSCPGDLDGSGDVGFSDVLTVLSAWGNAGGPADLDGSGTVGFGDLLIVLSSWGACA